MQDVPNLCTQFPRCHVAFFAPEKKTSKKKILIISNLKWKKMKNLEEGEINFEEKFLEMLKDKNFKHMT